MAGIGWEHLHAPVDDRSRIAFSDLPPDECADSTVAFMRRSLAYYARLGRAVLTDNGSAYRSPAFAADCRRLGLKHRFIRPYTPRTNGKAERFIQTALREWAYGPLLPELCRTQPGASLLAAPVQLAPPSCWSGLLPPVSRSGLQWNNLLSLHG
ncbi:MAG: DDE-type integrase/transposase/recombinase [Terriglobales bacterium]